MSDTSLVLHHHPFTRAATTIWMLEEVGQPYSLRYVDVRSGEQRQPAFRAINPMGKIPVLVDGETVVTESAAIGLYLADRYASGRLAPPIDSPLRGPYLRWSLFAPSVIEPACMAKSSDWKVAVGQAGFGDYDSVLAAIEVAIGDGPYLLGDQFSMADITFGATLRFMLRFGMIEARSSFTQYVERLSARPACQSADAKNAAIIAERGLAR
jgi:glutathione S-transferase